MKPINSFIKATMFLTALSLTACGGGGGGGGADGDDTGGADNTQPPVTPTLTAPDLVDLGTQSFVLDQLVELRMNNSGGQQLTECSSDLPADFTVNVSDDGASCEVSGEATELTALTDFTVTAFNSAGSDSALIPIEIVQATPFITTWKTDNVGSSNDDQITIKVSPEFSYDFQVDWGDGSLDENVDADITHTYAAPGTYQVSITGTYPQPFFDNKFDTDSFKLLTIEQWGNRPWFSMRRAFFNADNLVINDTQSPDLSRATSLREMFAQTDNFNSDIGSWDISNITSLRAMFRNARSFNQDLSGWDVSQVTDMFRLFEEAAVFNQDLSGWDVSNVTDMSNMFLNASAFNQNIGLWNISKVTNMTDMLADSNLSIANYDALLNGWSVQSVQQGVTLGASPVQFSIDGQAARDVLTEAFAWSIIDGGFISLPNLDNAPVTFYTNNAVLYVIDNDGGTPDDCTSADLPDGLSVQLSGNGNTCEIVGVPSAVQTSTQSTITTSHVLGTADATIDITIVQETPFITTWKTDNVGASGNNQITITHSPDFSYDYRVEWGDGNFDENVTGDITHTYGVAGTYTVSITGVFPQSYFVFSNVHTDSSKLLSVEQWGDRSWLSMNQAFINCDNLVINDPKNPDLTLVTNMRNMFNNADNLSFAGNIDDWDVSNVTNMARLFSRADGFNQDIGSWDVSKVTDMSFMFSDSAFNQDIGAWDVSSVTNMFTMFLDANAFNQDIGAWDVSSVTDMSLMFKNASAFNQDIGAWDVSSVTEMKSMFSNAIAFDQALGAWDVSRVTDMRFMFNNAIAYDQELGDWDVSNVTEMDSMFQNSALSTENYDAILTGWSQLESLVNGVEFGAGSTTFSADSQAAKDILVVDFGWTITDDGLATP